MNHEDADVLRGRESAAAREKHLQQRETELLRREEAVKALEARAVEAIDNAQAMIATCEARDAALEHERKRLEASWVEQTKRLDERARDLDARERRITPEE